MAAMLSNLGFQVHVYEKRPAPEQDLASADAGAAAADIATSALKRSINLALSQRGMEALDSVGLLETVMKTAIPMPCRVIHQVGVAQDVLQAYGRPGEAIYSVSRQLLNTLLLQQTERDANSRVKFFFGYSLVSCDKEGLCVFRKEKVELSPLIPSNKNDAADDRKSAKSKGNESSNEIHVKFDLVIGADGAYSAVRDSVLKLGRISFSRSYIAHGYKELTIPPKMVPSPISSRGGSNTFLMVPSFSLENPHGLHIWPRGQFMLIALPNPDYSFTATLFAPFEGQDGFNSIDASDPSAVTSYFSRHFPDVLPLMPDIANDFKANPVGSLVTIRTKPWAVGSSLLIGDAAHAVVPFYGQGMNAAFEDCLILSNILKSRLQGLVDGKPSDSNWKTFLSHAAAEFDRVRRPAADALADLCIEHYADMASSTASTMYLLQKRLEAWLHYCFPSSFIPLYTMIAFTRIPYHEAVLRAAKQDRFTKRVLLAATCLGVGAVVGLIPRTALNVMSRWRKWQS